MKQDPKTIYQLFQKLVEAKLREARGTVEFGDAL